MEPLILSWTVTDPKGVHTRPAATLAGCAMSFKSQIRLQRPPREDWVDGKSPSRILLLGAGPGDTLVWEISGVDQEQALGALKLTLERLTPKP